MKKLTALLLCMALALSLSACGKGEKQNEGSKDTADASAAQSEDVSWDLSEFDVPAGYELRAAFAENNAPFSYVDKSGELAGVNVDIAKAVCEKNGWTLKAQSVDWTDPSARQKLLEGGDVDCVWGSASYSETTSEEALWTVYGGIYVDAVVLEDSEINKLSDLKGKRIEVEPTAEFALEGETATELGKQVAADAKKVEKAADAQTAYQDLVDGKCDAIVVAAVADDAVDFESFDSAFKIVYDVDVYSEGDSSEENFDMVNTNSICDVEMGACFAQETDLYYAVAVTLEDLLSQGKVESILSSWSEQDNGTYKEIIGRCNLYQMEDYEDGDVADSSVDWDIIEDWDEDASLEDNSSEDADNGEIEINLDDADESVIVVK